MKQIDEFEYFFNESSFQNLTYIKVDHLIEKSNKVLEKVGQAINDELKIKDTILSKNIVTGLNPNYLEYEEKTDELVVDLMK